MKMILSFKKTTLLAFFGLIIQFFAHGKLLATELHDIVDVQPKIGTFAKSKLKKIDPFSLSSFSLSFSKNTYGNYLDSKQDIADTRTKKYSYTAMTLDIPIYKYLSYSMTTAMENGSISKLNPDNTANWPQKINNGDPQKQLDDIKEKSYYFLFDSQFELNLLFPINLDSAGDLAVKCSAGYGPSLFMQANPVDLQIKVATLTTFSCGVEYYPITWIAVFGKIQSRNYYIPDSNLIGALDTPKENPNKFDNKLLDHQYRLVLGLKTTF